MPSVRCFQRVTSRTFALLSSSRLSSESEDVRCLFFLWLLCFLCLDFFSLGGFCWLAAILSSYDIEFEYATCTANTCQLHIHYQLHCYHKLIIVQTHKDMHTHKG